TKGQLSATLKIHLRSKIDNSLSLMVNGQFLTSACNSTLAQASELVRTIKMICILYKGSTFSQPENSLAKQN
ncbi:hypothetical protein, partial [uncultured Chryseobacterium sp.]|uniref:hypothetical protein n=1 Tax=uncultured Chryseobacterium sp. TaxID=259322 RepID=UPI0025FF585E